MPEGLKPFDIFKHTGFKVIVEPTLKPGTWKYEPAIWGEMVLMAPDVFKRLQTILGEQKQKRAASQEAARDEVVEEDS